MEYRELLKIVLYLAFLFTAAPLLGAYMAKVFQGERTFAHILLQPIERRIYSVTGIDPAAEMSWKQYAAALLVFNAFGFALLFLILLFQRYLPLNPMHLRGLSWHLAFNTAVSFVTNTNWQSYAGETTMSYLTQMAGLAVQNFLSAATGIAVLVALMRGFVRSTAKTVGNFWVDCVRSIVYVLLPLSLLFALILAGQGVIQNFTPAERITTLEGHEQVIPLGPVASQAAIKQLGTNGGGYFGVNSAHPFENPTPLSNFIEMILILLLPASLVFTFGIVIRSRGEGAVLLAVMLSFFAVGLAIALAVENGGNPAFGGGCFMEGKETRFGITESVLWGEATTCAANGSVNAMHDSMAPLTGFVFLFNLMLGEVVFGGVGAGLYGMLMYVILTVFIAGLMVGRTPEYLGKKIGKREIQMAAIAVLLPSFAILIFSAIAGVTGAGLAGLANRGPHGLSEILYAFSSAAGNNGSAFAGLATDTPFYNVLLGVVMLAGRYGVIVPVIAIAGSIAGKKTTPTSPGTFRTDTPLFASLLIGVILIVGALTFLPALTLGPLLEQLLMRVGRLL